MNEHATIEAAADAPTRPARPALSVCIPTYNRAPYLKRLLARLAEETADFREQIEIVVSDNASGDDTQDVCRAAGLGDALRVIRQPENIGALRNMWAALSAARGKYAVYLADDDILLWPGVFRALNLLETYPDAVALYAPWKLLDLVGGGEQQFYAHEGVHVFSHADRPDLAEFILTNGVFSEISIVRIDRLRRIVPLQEPLAFWGFTVPCELVGFGDVIYADTPFYGSVVRHPDLEPRTQLGNEEVMHAWDRYRGGVEHLIGLAGALPQAKRAKLRQLADTLIEHRMLVALRLRLHQGCDAIESYHLASRLRGLGHEANLPVPMAAIRLRAAMTFLTDRIAKSIGATRLVLVGYDEEVAGMLASISSLPTERHDGGRLSARDVVMLAGSGQPDADASVIGEAGFVITETDLTTKFI